MAAPALDGRARVLAYFAHRHRHQTSPDPQDRCLGVKRSAEISAHLPWLGATETAGLVEDAHRLCPSANAMGGMTELRRPIGSVPAAPPRRVIGPGT